MPRTKRGHGVHRARMLRHVHHDARGLIVLGHDVNPPVAIGIVDADDRHGPAIGSFAQPAPIERRKELIRRID